jgi:ElaB/YqjD/DUF883 family membrane-anchored ribosome-binding protein
MTSSNDPDEIRRNIERTRAELSGDVDALTEKVTPSRVVSRRVDKVRSSVSSLRDRVMGPASDDGPETSDTGGSARESLSSAAGGAKDSLSSAASSMSDAASSAPSAVKERTQGNPLAAGIIAFGVGWLLSSLLPASEPEKQAATQVKDKATEVAQPQVQRIAQEVAGNLKEPAREAAEQVKSTATDATQAVSDHAKSAAQDVKEDASQATTSS